MTDFEDRLKQLLNEDVDHRLGPQRPAPPMRPPTLERPSSVRKRTRWLPPLLAAACIAVVAAGAIAAPQLLSDDRNPADPVAPTPTVSTDSPSPSPSVVTALGARVALPDGWRVGRTLPTYGGKVRMVCLQPSSQRLATAYEQCPVLFLTGTADAGISADQTAGFAGFVDCNAKQVALLDSGDRRIGNRDASWRVDRCGPASRAIRQETYVVATDPGYALFTDKSSVVVRQAITTIAQGTQLPVQDRPVRLYDYGILRQVRADGGVVRIRLDRTVPSPSGERNNSTATYSYAVPLTVWNDARAYGVLRVGSHIALNSDGDAVTRVRPA